MQFYISLLGLFVSFLVLNNIKTHNRANYFLVIFLFLVNLFVVMNYSTMLSNNKYIAAIFMVHFMPLIALTGPALYLYIRSVLADDASLKKADLLHLVIPLLFFINTFYFDFFVTWEEKLIIANKIVTGNRNQILNFQPVLFSGEISYMIRQCLAIGYTFYSTILVFRHYKHDFRIQNQNMLIFRWLIILLLINYIMNFSILYYVIKMVYYWKYLVGQSIFFVSNYFIAISSVTLLNLTLFFFPSILYGLPRMDFILNEQREVKVMSPSNSKVGKEFEISEQKLDLISLKLKEYCLGMPYIRSNFTLALMSSEINIPVHHISYYFNEFLKIDFISWRNNLRINYVVQLMDEGLNQYLTLDALSKKAGFNSRATFINAFKQQRGCTPSEYLLISNQI